MKELKTVDRLELDRYLGKWYEIVRLPNSFEKGLICVTAEYSLREDGKITVINSGVKKGKPEKRDTATGKAWIPDPNHPARLKVQFFWPFAGNYYVFHLDDDYRYALVGEPGRKYFWLLSRTPTISDELYDELIAIAAKEGFATEEFYRTPQECD